MICDVTGNEFLEFGAVCSALDDGMRQTLICQPKRIRDQRCRSQFLRFDRDVYMDIQSGNGILSVSRDPRSAPIAQFGITCPLQIRIRADVYFSFVASTPELLLDMLLPQDYSLDLISLAMPSAYQPALARIHVDRILGYSYRIRTTDCRMNSEQHDDFELTYVDTGCLYTEVDGKTYRLQEKEMIICGPGQRHTQYTARDQAASYMTILFSMKNLNEEMGDQWYRVFTDRVFPYHKKVYTLIKSMIQESTSGVPYMDSLLASLLTEILIRLLQAEHAAPVPQNASIVRHNYQDELFNRIVAYIESKIYEPLTVAELCHQFSLSRSSLQLLFKNAVNQSPKKYISDLKLERSCQMLRENKYTISEISLRLGYSSIHYFSNVFNQKYHISPSEYAKRIY